MYVMTSIPLVIQDAIFFPHKNVVKTDKWNATQIADLTQHHPEHIQMVFPAVCSIQITTGCGPVFIVI